MQRLDDFYYAWGAGAGDFNRDGVLDVVSGPFYYLGPDYTTRRELYVAPAQSPTANFAPTWTDYAFDFTGDGWTDVLTGRRHDGGDLALPDLWHTFPVALLERIPT